MSEIEFSCWCCATQRQVQLKGRIVGKRQADLLEVTNCEHREACSKVNHVECLVGKLLEGRWP